MNKKRALAKAIRKLGGGRTLKDIAAQAGLNKSMLSLYANEKRYPRYSNIVKLAKGLDCTPEELEEVLEEIEHRYDGEGRYLTAKDRPVVFGSDDWIDHLAQGAKNIDDEVVRTFLEGLVISMRNSQVTYHKKKVSVSGARGG